MQKRVYRNVIKVCNLIPKKIILLLFLIWIVAYLQAQTSTQSGNIRSCVVWGNPSSLNNATISSGHTITTNSTATSANSITFSSSSATLNLNAGELVNLGSSTNTSVCTSGAIANVNTTYSDGFLAPNLESASEASLPSMTISGITGTIPVTITIDYSTPTTGNIDGGIPPLSSCWIPVSIIQTTNYLKKNGSVIATNIANPGNNTFNISSTATNGDIFQVTTKLYLTAAYCILGNKYISGYNHTFNITIKPNSF